MSNVGATVNVTVVVPVQFTVPSLEVFCMNLPWSTLISCGAVVKVKSVFEPFTVPVGVWGDKEPAVTVMFLLLFVSSFAEVIETPVPDTRFTSVYFVRTSVPSTRI